MEAETSRRLVERYLKELRAASRGLSRAERRELAAQIEEHIATALADLSAPSEADVREVLERLGEPEEIVAEQFGPRAARRGMGAQAVTAIVLLLIGGFLAGIGWIAGVVLLWTSQAWTVRDKIVGTLILPGGLFGSLLLSSKLFLTPSRSCFGGIFREGRHVVRSAHNCTPGPSTAHVVLYGALFFLLIGAPIATAVLLARSANPLPA
jgi:hypothetical protein